MYFHGIGFLHHPMQYQQICFLSDTCHEIPMIAANPPHELAMKLIAQLKIPLM